MAGSFFQSDKKRKRTRPGTSSGSSKQPYEKPFRPAAYGKGQKPKGPGAARQKAERDEDLSSDAEGERGAADLDMMDFRAGRVDEGLSDGELIDENETAAEKRVRLAKGYLARVRDQVQAEREDDAYDAAEIDRELIASRLQRDVAEVQGRIHLYLSAHLSSPRTHFLSSPSHLPTSVALTPTSLFISTKHGSIFRYSLPSLHKVGKPFGAGRASPSSSTSQAAGHRGDILCLAASEDGKWLVSGGRDRVIGVWDLSGYEARWVTGMKGHKDAVTHHGHHAELQSVALPPLANPSHHILTASLSRHLALHSLATLSLIDTFFGHQDSVPCVSSLKPTVAVTSGSRDRSCRWWKVEEEVQLVFRAGGRSVAKNASEADGGPVNGHEDANGTANGRVNSKADRKGKGREYVEGSTDVVCMLDDQHFLSGGDSGSICIWNTGKKKPIFTFPLAHGVEADPGESIQGGARCITSLAALRGTDLFASGSWDGHIRLFALDPSLRSFKPVITIPVNGFINALSILALPAASVDVSSWSHQATPTPRPQERDSASTPGADFELDHGEDAEDHSLSDGFDDAVGPHIADKPVGLDAAMPAKSESMRGGRKNREIMLVAAVSREPRLGRWMRLKEGVRNGCLVAHLALDQSGRAMLT